MSTSHLHRPSAGRSQRQQHHRSRRTPSATPSSHLSGDREGRSRPAGSQDASQRDLDRSRECTLWTHDDKFSKEDVVLDATRFPDSAFKVGDLAEIVVIQAESTVQDSRDLKHQPRVDVAKKRRSRSAQPPNDPSRWPNARGCSPSNELDSDSKHGRFRYLFVVQSTSRRPTAKQSNLQVCFHLPVPIVWSSL